MRFSNPDSVVLRWALLIALSSATAVAFAGQDRIDFDRLSIEQGLSQSIIEQMVQDQKGFMWFATEDGLNRFDGYRFTVNVYGFLQMNRIDPMQRFTQSSLRTEKPHLLGFEKQLVPEIRMRNTDHGHGTFLQTFTE